jgi:hypothetical protein
MYVSSFYSFFFSIKYQYSLEYFSLTAGEMELLNGRGEFSSSQIGDRDRYIYTAQITPENTSPNPTFRKKNPV